MPPDITTVIDLAFVTVWALMTTFWQLSQPRRKRQ